MREFEVLFAPLADVDVASSFEATVQDFAVIVGLDVYRNASESPSATCGSEEVTVDIRVEKRYREEPEPYASHPFSASVKAHDARDDRAMAATIYERLVASGRFRAILLGDANILMSSHFPMSAW